MGITFQKAALMLALGICTSSTLANTVKTCSEGDLMVGNKVVGKARYAAQNCQANWQNQTIEMQFHYSENIPGWAFKRAANHFLKKNIQGKIEHFDKISNAYQSIQAGDRYSLFYRHSNQTLSLSLNGQNLARLQHPKAQQYFNIWLGNQPFSVKLKQQLLN